MEAISNFFYLIKTHLASPIVAKSSQIGKNTDFSEMFKSETKKSKFLSWNSPGKQVVDLQSLSATI